MLPIEKIKGNYRGNWGNNCVTVYEASRRLKTDLTSKKWEIGQVLGAVRGKNRKEQGLKGIKI